MQSSIFDTCGMFYFIIMSGKLIYSIVARQTCIIYAKKPRESYQCRLYQILQLINNVRSPFLSYLIMNNDDSQQRHYQPIYKVSEGKVF